MCGILDMLCQFMFKFGTYITRVRILVHDNLFHNQIKDWQPSCFLKMCDILDVLCQFSFKFDTYIIHVRMHVPLMFMTICFVIGLKMTD